VADAVAAFDAYRRYREVYHALKPVFERLDEAGPGEPVD
jgi:hypothetical protein